MIDRWQQNSYVHLSLDRAAHRRATPILDIGLWGANARILPVWQGRSPFLAGEVPLPLMLEAGNWQGGVSAFLGEVGGIGYFMSDMSDLDEAAANQRLTALSPDAQWAELRQHAVLLDRETAALLAYARGLAYWQRRHRFCGNCGSPTIFAKGGHVLSCSSAACGVEHFPRTDPAVIVLIHRGDRALLGRQASWTPGMYSTLAGFVEPGETLEQAVIREVMEESGIRVGGVTYHSSQPWPFPSSLMVGFFAAAETETIQVDKTELEDARWFTRDQLARGEELGGHLPRRDSIARRLIEDWIAGR
ncbi:NAD(+) diphosphatase [Lacibacterium aquatile]|uniref:NAD(+) diphosphatase n=1 Tax=Lacibacterium aquatile TaxID=1168082 RepID=A0ABW5DLU1_9PROT